MDLQGYINGTTYISRTNVDAQRLPNNNRWVVLEQFRVANYVLASAPKEIRGQAQLRPEVAASLERSLKDHADVWAELSKH